MSNRGEHGNVANKQFKMQESPHERENQGAEIQTSHFSEQPANGRALQHQDKALFLQMTVGFGLLLCFITMQSLMGSKLPPMTMSVGYAPLIVQRCLEAVTFLTVALFSTRIQKLASHRALMWICSTALIAEAVIEGMTILGAFPITGAALSHFAYCVVGSIVPSILWMAWIELYALLDMRRVTLLFLGANVLQALLTLLLNLQTPLLSF